MIGIFDVCYSENNSAHGACILIDNFQSNIARERFEITIDNVPPYESGQFSKRELPVILQMIEKIGIDKFDIIIIDAYVNFNENHHALGYNLYNALDCEIPVIGVAKSKYKTDNQSIAITRGNSNKALYITSIGIDVEDAAQSIKTMHGSNRLPKMIKDTDSLSRGRREKDCL